ncbi:threonine aldolase family protein [Chryseobacterium sp. T1]
MTYFFKNDYAEACHPRILQALIDSNSSQELGYGEDRYSKDAKELLKQKIDNPTAEIHFVSGGTQTNLIVISSILRPHESVISAISGHILNNETGAIEATGHKINQIISQDGKLRPADIQGVLDAHANIPHQVKPKLVYISNSTELGTIYTKQELTELYQYCQERKLLLFMDGARLSQALAIENSDLQLEDIARLTDVFYFGGTKNGALIGEAIVITNPALQEDFGFHVKQKGALLAKGRLLGIQFLELLKDDLYLELGSHANQQAMKIKKAFSDKDVRFLTESHTNQLFPILKTEHIEKLLEKFQFYVWQKVNDKESAVRLITSWATTDEAVDALVNEIESLL